MVEVEVAEESRVVRDEEAEAQGMEGGVKDE